MTGTARLYDEWGPAIGEGYAGHRVVEAVQAPDGGDLEVEIYPGFQAHLS